jgi:antirestriction protein ArdC
MPHLSQFESADEFFSTLYHELTHYADTRIMPHGFRFLRESRAIRGERAA